MSAKDLAGMAGNSFIPEYITIHRFSTISLKLNLAFL